jgi:hypothetical protein
MSYHIVDFESIYCRNNDIIFGSALSLPTSYIDSIELRTPFEIIINTKDHTKITIESLYAPRYDYYGECWNIPEGELYYLTRNNNTKIQYLQNLIFNSNR